MFNLHGNRAGGLLRSRPPHAFGSHHVGQSGGDPRALGQSKGQASQDPKPPQFSVEDLPISAVHLSPAGEIVLAGCQVMTFKVLDRSFQVSAGSFFQINTVVTEKVVQYLLENLEIFHPLGMDTILVDAYCGVGLFSAFLASKVGRLIGIEVAPSSADDFVENLDEFENIELYEAPVEQVLPGLNIQPDILLVDPPRAGIHRKALDSVLAMKPPLLVYVSCDPATLARDAKRLVKGGYKLDQITPFDMFPHTYHIESISFWTV